MLSNVCRVSLGPSPRRGPGPGGFERISRLSSLSPKLYWAYDKVTGKRNLGPAGQLQLHLHLDASPSSPPWAACSSATTGSSSAGRSRSSNGYFELTSEVARGWANSCALIGCLVGALIAGALSDRFGRKRLLIFSAFLFAVTSVGNGLAPAFTDLRRLAHAGRRGHRPGVEPLADVHRRGRARADARPARRDQPAHHRHRHPAGAVHQLVPRAQPAAGRHATSSSAIPGTARQAGAGCSP